MKTIKVIVRTDIVGSQIETEFEVEDNASLEEIEKAAFETAMELVDWNYEVIE